MFKLYVIDACPYCSKSIKIMKSRKLEHNIITVTTTKKKSILKKKYKQSTFPMILFNNNLVGGLDSLENIINKCDMLNNLLDNAFKGIPKKTLGNILDLCCVLSNKKNACKLKSLCKK